MIWSDLTDREEYMIKRRRKGIHQKQAAEALGVHLSTISKWENGIYTPNTKDSKNIIEKYKFYIDNIV